METSMEEEDRLDDAAASAGICGAGGHTGDRSIALGVARCGSVHFGIPIENLAEVAQVTELRPLAHASEHVLGALDLRGLLVPVVDLSGLTRCGATGRESSPFAAILRIDRRLMAIGIDEIDGMLRVPAGALQRISQAGALGDGHERAGGGDLPPDAQLTRGSLLHDGRVITVLDPAALLVRSGLLSVPNHAEAPAPGSLPDAPKDGQPAFASETDRLLIFSVGGAELALRATEIQGTVPRTAIEENALTSGFCIGSILHHKQRIPVLRTQMLTGLGSPSNDREAEIVLLRLDERQRIGLAVDRIERMMSMDRARIHPIPALMADPAGVLEGILPARRNERQVFLLSPSAIVRNETVRELGRLSVRKAGEPKDPLAEQSGRSDVIRERLRYLVFQAGTTLAAPAAQILRIVEPPTPITPCVSTVPGVEGVFQFDGKPALLIDLACRLGLHRQHAPDRTGRVLVVSNGEHLVGFGADAVDGIETSVWKRVGKGRRDAGTIVQLGRGADRHIVPVLDLNRLAESSSR